MNSSSRSDKKRPRMTLASSVQPISDMITVIAKYTCVTSQSRGSAAAKPIHSGIVGIDLKISIIRWMSVSIAPP